MKALFLLIEFWLVVPLENGIKLASCMEAHANLSNLSMMMILKTCLYNQ